MAGRYSSLNSVLSNLPRTFAAVREALAPHYEAAVVQRFLDTLLRTAALAAALRQIGINIPDVGAAIGYYQSRRRHMVSLLYTIPKVCRGSDKLDALDALNILMPQVEFSCITITSLHAKLTLLETFENFTLSVDSMGMHASHGFDALETGFLEPERASIMAMLEHRPEQYVPPQQEETNPRKIFSAAELRNSTRMVAASYAAYDVDDDEFPALIALIDRLSEHAKEDYYVHVPKERFAALLAAQTAFDPVVLKRMLVNRPEDYATNTNAYEPFLDLGSVVVSNVNLLSRFLYAFKNVHLGGRRRFQIHAGFIFEDMVKRDLEEMGFTVTPIKRINHKEFDVVATLNGVIYNLQCKNNWVDLAKIEKNRKLFVRYNRRLTAYYSRALEKERQREQLLKTELGLDEIKHFVISRFPVMGANPHVINYNHIDTLREHS